MKKIPRRKSRPRSLPLASYAARNVFEPEVALFCRDVDGDDEEDGGMCSACLRQTTRPGNEDGAIISVDVKSGEFDNPRRSGRGRGGEGSGGGKKKRVDVASASHRGRGQIYLPGRFLFRVSALLLVSLLPRIPRRFQDAEKRSITREFWLSPSP